MADADKVVQQARRSALALYSLARVYSLAAAAVKSDENRPADERARKTEFWSATAMKLLNDAKDLDHFRYPQRLAALDADSAFANLRDRNDYQAFRTGLNQ